MKEFFMFFMIVIILSCIGCTLENINNTLKELLNELKVNNDKHKGQN